jgi:hypothetical protein
VQSGTHTVLVVVLLVVTVLVDDVVVAVTFTAGVQKRRARIRLSVRVPNWSVTSVSGGNGPRHLIL